MPRLDSPSLAVSLEGHTVHVTGLLPTTFTGRLPFYAKTEAAARAQPRAVPLLGVQRRRLATNSIGAFGGFPFIEYVCGHRDADGRVRSGIAFHGPITSHVIGFDRGARGTPVTVVAGYDSLLGKIIDVDYPSSGRTRPSASESVVFPIWQAVKRRGDGSTALDFPQWACETSRCAGMPANARDPFTGAAL